jgi:flagellar motor switch protein FliN/FliY
MGAPVDPSLIAGLDVLKDVPLRLTVELGRTRLLIRDVLALRSGAVVELDRPAGAPADVLVNGVLIARGEVVVVEDRFGVRIAEVLNQAQAG